jgi:recombination protein RecA
VISIKNRFYPADKIGHVVIDYANGVDKLGGLFDIAKDMSIIETKGPWVFFEGVQVAQGFNTFQTMVKEDQELQDRFIAAVDAQLIKTKYSTLEERENTNEIREAQKNILNNVGE